MIRDLRYACRALIRHRGYASATIVTLALGLGVNTAVATVAWSVLLRPMPIQDAERVVLVYQASPTLARLRQQISFPKFKEWRARNTVFQELSATVSLTLDLPGGGDSVTAAAVSDNFFSVLAVPPAEGRLLGPGDRYGTEGAVACVVSARLAHRMFGETSGITRRFEVPGPDTPDVPMVLLVVGVMPDGFERWRDRVDVWVPIEAPGVLNREHIFTTGYEVVDAVGRLRPGITMRQARASMGQLDRGVERDLEGPAALPPAPLRVVSLRDDVVPTTLQRMLWLFALAAVLVLVIAAANASSLALARLEARLDDVSIRRALGASSTAVFRHVFAETAVLAAISALAAVPLAYWSLRVLGAFSPVGISGQVVRFSAAVAAFTTALTLVTATAMAALQHSALWRVSGDSMLHGASASPRQASRRLDVLFAIEIAVSVLVVIAGGLLMRNAVRLQHVDPGFQPHGVLVVSGTLEDSRRADRVTSEPELRVASLLGVILERAAGIAGVEVVAAGRSAPLDGRPIRRASIILENGSRVLNGDPDAFAKTPDLLRVSPRYFEALGIPLRVGRVFGDDDDRSRAPVVIVNETMAKLHWPGARAVGRRLKHSNLGASAPWAEVIGVVGDIRSESLHDPPRPELYAPLNELSGMGGRLTIFLKIREDTVRVAPRAMAALRDAHPRLRLSHIETLPNVVAASLSEQQYQAELIGVFALLALVLASVGVYGLLNYSVTRRRREMAIRMALGASSFDMAALVLRRGAALVFPGLTAGLVLSSVTTRVMQGLLFDISPTDSTTFALVSTLFVVLAVAAGVAPTRRATSVVPAITLREE